MNTKYLMSLFLMMGLMSSASCKSAREMQRYMQNLQKQKDENEAKIKASIEDILKRLIKLEQSAQVIISFENYEQLKSQISDVKAYCEELESHAQEINK